MEDYRHKKITKDQLWDKLHEERRMWQYKCAHDAAAAKVNTAIALRKIVDPILAKVVLAFGSPHEDGSYDMMIEIPKTRDGYEWQVILKEVDDKTWRIIAKEEELPAKEEVGGNENADLKN